MSAAQQIRVIDSHTGGEPTRVVIQGGPDLGRGSITERAETFRSEFDHYRSAVVNEPRGSDVLVGALLCEPADPSCAAGVIFFNNVGLLGMCGHGTIGLIVTLAHLGRIRPGVHRIQTTVGIVAATLHENGTVSVENVPAHRSATGIRVEVPGHGPVAGDIAWGGNWFFLVQEHGHELALTRAGELLEFTGAIRRAVNSGPAPLVDHVELFGPPTAPGAHSRNFVLCPGGAYDRSPCGTGTSAKLACLAASGKLAEGEKWVQESIVGSTFEGSFRWLNRAEGTIVPTITGTAHVTGDSTLILDPTDPFCWGFR